MSRTWTESRGKRALDIVLAVIGGLVLSPALLISAAAVRCLDGPGVLFRQVRRGVNGRPFSMLKFRTMHPGVPGPMLTASGDPRVSSVGRFLRRFKLDELPQLWNVIRGDMSFVGPRPELLLHVNSQAAAFRRLDPLRPGITDYASFLFRDEETLLARHASQEDYYTNILLPQKIALARLYRRHASFWLDLHIIAATVLAICRLGWAVGGLDRRLVSRTAGIRRIETADRFKGNPDGGK